MAVLRRFVEYTYYAAHKFDPPIKADPPGIIEILIEVDGIHDQQTNIYHAVPVPLEDGAYMRLKLKGNRNVYYVKMG